MQKRKNIRVALDYEELTILLDLLACSNIGDDDPTEDALSKKLSGAQAKLDPERYKQEMHEILK